MLISKKSGTLTACTLAVGLAIASPGSDYGRAHCGHIPMADITQCQACCDLGITDGDIEMGDREACHDWCEDRKAWSKKGPFWARVILAIL